MTKNIKKLKFGSESFDIYATKSDASGIAFGYNNKINQDAISSVNKTAITAVDWKAVSGVSAGTISTTNTTGFVTPSGVASYVSDQIATAIGSVYKVQGSETWDKLTATDFAGKINGNVYNVTAIPATGAKDKNGNNVYKGDNVVYVTAGTPGWDKLGTDLDGYITTADFNPVTAKVDFLVAASGDWQKTTSYINAASGNIEEVSGEWKTFISDTNTDTTALKNIVASAKAGSAASAWLNGKIDNLITASGYAYAASAAISGAVTTSADMAVVGNAGKIAQVGAISGYVENKINNVTKNTVAIAESNLTAHNPGDIPTVSCVSSYVNTFVDGKFAVTYTDDGKSAINFTDNVKLDNNNIEFVYSDPESMTLKTNIAAGNINVSADNGGVIITNDNITLTDDSNNTKYTLSNVYNSAVSGYQASAWISANSANIIAASSNATDWDTYKNNSLPFIIGSAKDAYDWINNSGAVNILYSEQSPSLFTDGVITAVRYGLYDAAKGGYGYTTSAINVSLYTSTATDYPPIKAQLWPSTLDVNTTYENATASYKYLTAASGNLTSVSSEWKQYISSTNTNSTALKNVSASALNGQNAYNSITAAVSTSAGMIESSKTGNLVQVGAITSYIQNIGVQKTSIKYNETESAIEFNFDITNTTT